MSNEKKYGDRFYLVAEFFESGIDTLLQLLIGYICATMATDRRINCNIVLVPRKDGTYNLIFVPKNNGQ
jgi:hypothetical protein